MQTVRINLAPGYSQPLHPSYLVTLKMPQYTCSPETTHSSFLFFSVKKVQVSQKKTYLHWCHFMSTE